MVGSLVASVIDRAADRHRWSLEITLNHIDQVCSIRFHGVHARANQIQLLLLPRAEIPSPGRGSQQAQQRSLGPRISRVLPSPE